MAINEWGWEDYEEEGAVSSEEGALVVKDANGAVLANGDTVAAIKDLKVKGGADIKRGR